MKRKTFLFFVLFLSSMFAQAQLISERTDGLVSIGFEMFTDFNTGEKYDNFKLRSINQGVSAYTMFNFPIAETKHIASVGLGFTSHNFYMKGTYLKTPYNDVAEFANVIYDYKRSKINTNYIDIPVEVSFRIKDKFKISAGFKFGILTSGKSKYVGELYDDDKMYRVKLNRINNLEKYVYSATLRVAYRSVYIFGAYQFSDTYKNGTGPEIKPLSIGIGVRPF